MLSASSFSKRRFSRLSRKLLMEPIARQASNGTAGSRVAASAATREASPRCVTGRGFVVGRGRSREGPASCPAPRSHPAKRSAIGVCPETVGCKPSARYNVPVSASLQFILPCCPVSVKAVPMGDGWQHGVKFDGYRVQVHKTGNDVVIYSRNGHVFTSRFETIAYLLWICRTVGSARRRDRGERPPRRSQFCATTPSLGVGRWAAPLVLRLASSERARWRHQPLEKRQDRLQSLIQRFDCPPVKASEPFTDGVKLLRVAERMKPECVVMLKDFDWHPPRTVSHRWE